MRRAEGNPVLLRALYASSFLDEIVSGDGRIVMEGLYITLEGGEGTGKSTQLGHLQDWFRQYGLPLITPREPGGTRLGDKIRAILLDPDHTEMDVLTELLLYEAARSQIHTDVIRPALAKGTSVAADRGADSSTAYQSFARGIPLDVVQKLNEIATKGRKPDLTIILDMDPAVSLVRATAQGADRLEREDLRFHEKVREGFLWLGETEPERVKIVSAIGSEDEVSVRVMKYIVPLYVDQLERK